MLSIVFQHHMQPGILPNIVPCILPYSFHTNVLWTCRVDAVQLALSSLTSIPPQEQILLLNGNPLDPSKPLGAYQLPTVRKRNASPCPCTHVCLHGLHPGLPWQPTCLMQ